MLPSAGLKHLLRGSNALLSSRFVAHSRRNISLSSVCGLKEIQKVEEGNKIIIEAKFVPSPREKYLAKELIASNTDDQACACCLCKLDLQIKHTDVLILSQFINSKGKLLPRKVTGLCKEQDKRVDYLLVMAEKAGLIDVYADTEKKPLTGWEGFNKYYDEAVIDEFIHGKRKRH